jgi:hypothetical protein
MYFRFTISFPQRSVPLNTGTNLFAPQKWGRYISARIPVFTPARWSALARKHGNDSAVIGSIIEWLRRVD